MPELTITSPYVHSRVDYNTFTMNSPFARVDLNPIPESTLFPSQVLWIWPLVLIKIPHILSIQRISKTIDGTSADTCAL